MGYTVSRVAELSRVSVRTLHHYDDIGLLHPSGRTESGYRLYTDADLERLQRVLFFRALGFGLDDIKKLMEEPGYDVRSALLLQRELLQGRIVQTQSMLDAVNNILESLDKGEAMDTENLFQNFDATPYEEEVEQRWGETDAFRISKKRTASYSKADWEKLKNESHTHHQSLAALLRAGCPADSEDAMQLAEAHRIHIDHWFYPLSHTMHCALGDMYVQDERFRKNIDRYGEGLSVYLRDAIRANARRRGEPPAGGKAPAP